MKKYLLLVAFSIPLAGAALATTQSSLPTACPTGDIEVTSATAQSTGYPVLATLKNGDVCINPPSGKTRGCGGGTGYQFSGSQYPGGWSNCYLYKKTS